MADPSPPPPPPLQTLQIPGATLAALLHLSATAPSSLSGHLSGHLSLSHSPISDDDDPISSSSTLTATLTSFLFSTTSQSSSLIGAFSSRRRSPPRLSLSDYTHCLNTSLDHDHNQNPFVFLLLTNNDQAMIDTFEFRAFQFRVRDSDSSLSFDPIAVEVVNIGPGFRAGYGSFCPNSRMPYLGYERGMGSPMRVEGVGVSLEEMKRVKEEERKLEVYAEGYDVGSLRRLMGGMNVGGIEELYEKMLGRLEGLAREVEVSMEKVIEKENRNNELRYKVLGLGG